MDEKLKELKLALDEISNIDKNNITEEQFNVILDNFNTKMESALPEINKLNTPDAQMFKFLCNLWVNNLK